MDKFVVRVDHKDALKEVNEQFPGHPTVVEIFAGCGGMALGLEQAGMRHVALIERDAHAVEALRANKFKYVHACDADCVDYTRFRGVDVVAGGPPCQPFSNGGVDGGSNDERDGWPIAIRAVHDIKPLAFLFENVAGLLREKFNDYFQDILRQFWEMGYSVHVHCVNAENYGVPQHRRRVFLAGIRGVCWFSLPKPLEKVVSVREVFNSLGPPNGENGHVLYRTTPRAYSGHCGSVLDKPAKTICSGTHCIAGGQNMIRLDDNSLRYFTPRELARLQTFPDDFKVPDTLFRAMKQIGNACPVRLARVFGVELVRCLWKTDPKFRRKRRRSDSPTVRMFGLRKP